MEQYWIGLFFKVVGTIFLLSVACAIWDIRRCIKTIARQGEALDALRNIQRTLESRFESLESQLASIQYNFGFGSIGSKIGSMDSTLTSIKSILTSFEFKL